MDIEQVGALLALALANYPNMQDKNMAPTLILWQKMLSDIPYKVAENALMKVLSTAKFFPTVAEIRQAAAEITNPRLPSAAEAWGEVIQAVQRYGLYREQEALAFMTPAVRQVVAWIGWHDICTCEEPDVLRGQFRRAYEQHEHQEKDMAALPGTLRQLVDKTAEKKAIEEPKGQVLLFMAPVEEETIPLSELEELIKNVQLEESEAGRERLRASIGRMNELLDKVEQAQIHT